MDEQNASTAPESTAAQKNAAECRGATGPLENASIYPAATTDAIAKIDPAAAASDASEEEEAPPATFAFAVEPEEIECATAPEPAIAVAPAAPEAVAASAITPAATAVESVASSAGKQEHTPVQTTANATPFEVIAPVVAAPETTASEALASNLSTQEIVPPILDAVILESATRNVIPAESAQEQAAIITPSKVEMSAAPSAVIDRTPVETISPEATIAEARAPEVPWFEPISASAETSTAAASTPQAGVSEASAVETPAAESAAAEISHSPAAGFEIAAPEIVVPQIMTPEIAAPENTAPAPIVVEAKPAEAKPAAEKPAQTASENSKALNRPFRVKLRGSVLVLVRLPNRRDVRAAIHQLSTSGGVIHLEKPLDEKIVVDLIFHLGGKTIREKAQMLFPMWATQGWMQPFRFTQLSEADRQALDGHLKTFISGEPAKGAAAGS